MLQRGAGLLLLHRPLPSAFAPAAPSALPSSSPHREPIPVFSPSVEKSGVFRGCPSLPAACALLHEHTALPRARMAADGSVPDFPMLCSGCPRAGRGMASHAPSEGAASSIEPPGWPFAHTTQRREAWGTGTGGWEGPSALPWGGPICSAVSGAGLPRSRKMRSYWRESSGGLRGW